MYLTLRYTYNSTSSRPGASRVSPLGPWTEKDPDTIEFATLKRKEDVLVTLQRAQLAILNPSRSPDLFRPGQSMPVPTTLQVPFSPNIVRLDISGPALLNLSFYDLPGVITQDEEEYVPKLITNLVREYIKPSNCIVLQTLTMNHDAANSNAASIIRASKADGRTVGVLTKPDLFINDSMNEWLQILNGEKFHLKQGYFVVKNNPDPLVPHSDARVEEEEFFNTQAPFNGELSPHRQRFGTIQLQKALSVMLATEIEKSLPDIIDKIGMKLDQTRETLQKMPKPLTGNVSLEVHNKIHIFDQILKKELLGGQLDCKFFAPWQSAAQRFRHHVVCSYPLLLFPHAFRPAAEANRTSPASSNGHNRTPNIAHALNLTPGGSQLDPMSLDSDDDGAESTSPTKKARTVGGNVVRKRAGDANPVESFEQQLNKLKNAVVARCKCVVVPR